MKDENIYGRLQEMIRSSLYMVQLNIQVDQCKVVLKAGSETAICHLSLIVCGI